MQRLEFGAELCVFSGFFIYIRIIEMMNFQTCTGMGSAYSAVIFILIGILTMFCWMFAMTFVITSFGIRVFRLYRRYFCCCGGRALLYKNIAKVPYSKVKFSAHADCAVCLMTFEEGDIVSPLPRDIKHFFHHHCIQDWLKKNPICPLCKKEVTLKQLKGFNKDVKRLLREE